MGRGHLPVWGGVLFLSFFSGPCFLSPFLQVIHLILFWEMTQKTITITIRSSIVASIPACHAGDPGSIPGFGVFEQNLVKGGHTHTHTGGPLSLWSVGERSQRFLRCACVSTSAENTVFTDPLPALSSLFSLFLLRICVCVPHCSRSLF